MQCTDDRVLQFYNLVDVLDECSRKVPSLYTANLVSYAYDAFMEFFEPAVTSLKDKDKLKLLCDCAVQLVVLLTDTRMFSEALRIIALIC